jgi:hypothetical protein
MFRVVDRCIHPTLRGEASDARCAVCPSYKGSPRGLGDIVHSIAKATGIEAAVNLATDGKCNCPQRRAALNAAVPFTDKANEG